MSTWRPALRMARRDLRRHKVRAILTCILVALPVLVATVAALTAHNDRWTHEVEAQRLFHGGDGLVVVSPFTEIRARSALDGWPAAVRGAEERDPSTIDPISLLPEGTKIAPEPQPTSTVVTSGGQAMVLRVDLADPLTADVADIIEGRAPSAPDEIAMSLPVAEELGLTSGDSLDPDARFTLPGGLELAVVGIVDSHDDDWVYGGLTLLAPPDSVAPTVETPDEVEQPRFLVDLPAMDHQATQQLVADLAGQGIGLQPRDAVEHPEAWGVDSYDQGPIDLTPVLVGGVCILVGLVEVVLLVGAAFSVAARRQVRDLGLLATNGGAPVDLRRILLAQGVVLGVLSSLVGAGLGVATFLLGADLIETRLLTDQLNGHEVPWWIVVAMAALGSVTSVVAALLPGWRMARLSPVDALSGRFPIQPGESRAHRPAFVLAGGGLLLLALGGAATAAAKRAYPNWLGVSVLVAGLGLGVLVAGTVWATPYVVRVAAGIGRKLPLSGRYAFRDAGRHRFRSAAAVMVLMITVAGAVLAGFAIASADRSNGRDYRLASHVISVDLCCAPADPARLTAVGETLERVVDPVRTAASSYLSEPGHPERTLMLGGVHDSVSMVDEESLRMLADVDAEALEVFRGGGVLTTYSGGAVRNGHVKVRVDSGPGKDRGQWTLPGAHVSAREGMTPYTQPTYISPETAESLGLEAASSQLVVLNGTRVSSNDLERLRAYGLWVDSDDPERALTGLAKYSGIAVAGLLASIVVGIAVALAAAESRDDVATLAAVGAAPWTRRRFGAMHGLFLGLVGTALGAVVGVASGLALTQVDGLPGVDLPWTHLLGTIALVLPLSWLVGGIVTPSRFTLTRRTA